MSFKMVLKKRWFQVLGIRVSGPEMSFKMVLKKRWFQVLGIRSRCSPQNLGLYMARVGESSKLKTISFAGQCESVANPSRDSNHVRDKLLTTWEGAIEQVASRNFFVKSCDFLQVASFHFSGRWTSFWPGRRQKKNHPGWFECDAARSIASIK